MIVATVLAPTKFRERKKLKSTTGARALASTIRKATVATTPPASSPTSRADPQPQSLPSISASTKAEGHGQEDDPRIVDLALRVLVKRVAHDRVGGAQGDRV